MVATEVESPEPVRVVGIEDRILLEASTHDSFREDSCQVVFTVLPTPNARWRELFNKEAEGYDAARAIEPSSIHFGIVKGSTRTTIELANINLDDIPEHLDILKNLAHRTNTRCAQEATLEAARQKQQKRRHGLCLERRIMKVTGNLSFGA